MEIREKIELANANAKEIREKARPVWIDVKPAGEVIPGMDKNVILVAGPPALPEDIVFPVKTSVCGAMVYEGIADNAEEAWNKVLKGEVRVESAQNYNTACGAAMALSCSMPVCVVKDSVFGGEGYCGVHPGNKPNVLRWGYYNEEVQRDLVWFRDHYGPALGMAVRALGGLDLVTILSKTAGMGDENHNREPAASMNMVLQLIPALLDLDVEYKNEIIKELSINDRFFLHCMMAGAEAVISSVKGIPYCTVMVGMGGNGKDFGLQFASLGNEWFTTPAPIIKGLFLKTTYTEKDMLGFLGDSCVVEVYGLGGMSAIAGPAFVMLTGSTFEDARKRTENSRAVSVGEHRYAPIPWDENRGFPTGIDMRKVVGLNIVPTSHGGGCLKAGGQGTIGSAALPMECFRKGLEAFSKQIESGVLES